MALTRAEKVKIIKSESSIYGHSVSNSYYKHAISYGNFLDVRVYKDAKVTFKGQDNSHNRKESGEKRYDSVARAKVKLYRLIVGNVKKHGNFKPIFATYTFADDVTSHREALRYYKLYRKRLSDYLGFSPKSLTVPQIQWERYEKTGKKVWHFHTVFFDVSKLSIKINDKLWGQGMVNLQYVKGYRDIGAYLAGYFTKEDYLEIPLNARFYYPTRGLFHPVDYFNTDTIDSILLSGNNKVLSVYEGDSYTQIKYKLK